MDGCDFSLNRDVLVQAAGCLFGLPNGWPTVAVVVLQAEIAGDQSPTLYLSCRTHAAATSGFPTIRAGLLTGGCSEPFEGKTPPIVRRVVPGLEFCGDMKATQSLRPESKRGWNAGPAPAERARVRSIGSSDSGEIRRRSGICHTRQP